MDIYVGHDIFRIKNVKFHGVFFEQILDFAEISRNRPDLQKCPFPWGHLRSHVIHVPWTHATQHSKQHHVTAEHYVSISQMVQINRL